MTLHIDEQNDRVVATLENVSENWYVRRGRDRFWAGDQILGSTSRGDLSVLSISTSSGPPLPTYAPKICRRGRTNCATPSC